MNPFANKSWGVILLCLFLALVGLFSLTNFTTVFAEAVILGVVGIAAAIALFVGK